MGVAGSPIKHDLGLSDSQFGALHGMAFVGLYCLFGIPLGWLADRADRRRIIAGGLVFWTVMTAGCGLAKSFAAFFVARIGVGLGEACLLPAGMSLLGSSVPEARMARAVAIFLMGATAGNAFALLAGGQLLSRLDSLGPMALPITGSIAPWRILFLLACLPGLIVAGLFLAFREPPRRTAPGLSRGQSGAAIAHLRANLRAYTLLTAATACSVTLAQAQAAWIPQLYGRHFGLSPGTSATTVGFLFLLSAPAGQWLGGQLIDHLRAKSVAAAPNVILACCGLLCLPAATIFCLSNRLWLSELTYGVFNFLVFAATPAGLTGWQCLTPERYAGLVTALLVSIVTLIGVGLGPVLVGLVTDYIFHDEGALGKSLLTVISIAGMGSCVFALAGKRAFVLAAESAQSGREESSLNDQPRQA